MSEEIEVIQNKIQTPSDLRTILGESIVALLEGRINVTQANAVSSLSAEVHNSISQEWDMRCYMAEHLSIKQAEVVRGVIGAEGIDVELIKERHGEGDSRGEVMVLHNGKVIMLDKVPTPEWNALVGLLNEERR